SARISDAAMAKTHGNFRSGAARVTGHAVDGVSDFHGGALVSRHAARDVPLPLLHRPAAHVHDAAVAPPGSDGPVAGTAGLGNAVVGRPDRPAPDQLRFLCASELSPSPDTQPMRAAQRSSTRCGLQVILEPTGAQPIVAKILVADNGTRERKRCPGAFQDELIESPQQALNGLATVSTVSNQLTDH